MGIKTVLIACMASAVYGDAQVFGLHGGYGVGVIPAAVGAVARSTIVKDVVETPAEVSEVVTPVVSHHVVGYAGHHLGYAGHLGYGLGHAGHLLGKREADPEADAAAYYGYGGHYGYAGYAGLGYGYGGYGYGHHLGYRGYLGYAGHHGYGYGHGFGYYG